MTITLILILVGGIITGFGLARRLFGYRDGWADVMLGVAVACVGYIIKP